MKFLMLFLCVLALGSLAYLVYVRFAPDRLAVVHVDPLQTGESSARSIYRNPPRAPVFAAPPDAVFAAADGFILSWPGTTRHASGPAPFHASYVTRTRVLKFPDDLSIQVIETEGGATLAVYARSRLSGYDWGTNRARVQALLAHLKEQFPPDT